MSTYQGAMTGPEGDEALAWICHDQESISYVLFYKWPSYLCEARSVTEPGARRFH